MPQMMPIKWLFLTLIIMMILLLIINSVYFFYYLASFGRTRDDYYPNEDSYPPSKWVWKW